MAAPTSTSRPASPSTPARPVLTAPWLIHDLFSLCGKRSEEYVRLVALDPFYNIRFDDGSVFRYNGNRAALLARIRGFNAADMAGYQRYLA